jgi:hypothetical protein
LNERGSIASTVAPNRCRTSTVSSSEPESIAMISTQSSQRWLRMRGRSSRRSAAPFLTGRMTESRRSLGWLDSARTWPRESSRGSVVGACGSVIAGGEASRSSRRSRSGRFCVGPTECRAYHTGAPGSHPPLARAGRTGYNRAAPGCRKATFSSGPTPVYPRLRALRGLTFSNSDAGLGPPASGGARATRPHP